MSVGLRIRDGEGSGREAGVTQDRALKVSVVNRTASDATVEELTRVKQLRSFLQNGGSVDMNVDGSATPVEFIHEADTGIAKWITGVRFLFHSDNMELDTNDFRRFGAAAIAPGLANGLTFFVLQGGTQTSFFPDPVKAVGDFMSYADDYTNFINSVGTQTDFLSFDFKFDEPVALPEGSEDKIVVKVEDNLTALDLFKVIVRGYQEVLA